jgi:hypothetical protein
MTTLEALPFDIGAVEEELLPYWLVQQALPQLTCPERLVRWLSARAELLEKKQRDPQAALHLLGTVLTWMIPGGRLFNSSGGSSLPAGGMEVSLALSNSIADACTGAHCFPGAVIKRDAFRQACLCPCRFLPPGHSPCRAWRRLPATRAAWGISLASSVS